MSECLGGGVYDTCKKNLKGRAPLGAYMNELERFTSYISLKQYAGLRAYSCVEITPDDDDDPLQEPTGNGTHGDGNTVGKTGNVVKGSDEMK